MSLLDADLFDVWRSLLTTACGVYTLLVTARWATGWLAYFSSPDRRVMLLRRYVVVHALRLRLHRFTGELVQIGGWAALLAILIGLHWR